MTYAEFIKIFGYILAPILKGCCEWFMENAKYTIKMSLRSSEPFMMVAKLLVELNPDKYYKMKNWEGVFINRDISSRLKERNIDLYCKKCGLDKLYTMCDIGYSDKIFQNMKGSVYQPNEFLQMFAANGKNYFDDCIKKIYSFNFDFFVNFTFDDEFLTLKFDEFFSHYIMHFLPKTYKKHNDAACAEFSDDGTPILLDNKNPFMHILYDGVFQSLEEADVTERDSINFFCSEDLAWIQHNLLLAHNNYYKTPWNFCNPEDIITEKNKTLYAMLRPYKK